MGRYVAVIGEIWGVLAVDGRLLRVLGRLGLRRSRRARLVTVRVGLGLGLGLGIGFGNACAIVLPSVFTSSSRSSSVRAAVFLIRALYAAFSAAILACSASRLLRA